MNLEKEFNVKSNIKLNLIYGNEYVNFEVTHPRHKDHVDLDHVEYILKTQIRNFNENGKSYTLIILFGDPYSGYFENEKKYKKEIYVSMPDVFSLPLQPFILKTLDGKVIIKKEHICNVSIFETKVLYDTSKFDDSNTNAYHKVFVLLENHYKPDVSDSLSSNSSSDSTI